ncbi:MAG: NUDIX domain-containing protein [Parcubacteria group bacterium]|nr:NUDIX domain-containing protein [Parcubacteria group bacterium]
MSQTVPDNERHRIVLTCIIHDGRGRYLVTKRAPTKKAFPNKWTVPGGGLEPRDYLKTKKTTKDAWYFVVEKALRREVKEEVNLEIEKPQFLVDLVFIRPDKVPVLTLSYMAKRKSGAVVLEEGDATEFRWATVKECRKLDFIDGIFEEIVYADKILKGARNPRIGF